MEIVLQGEERFRIDGGYGDLSNFIDVSKVDFAGIGVDIYSGFQYIELRKKQDRLKLFTFPKKSIKKEYDFGWWSDAEIVYSLNEQYMHK